MLQKYVGIKNEIISKGEARNYIFHINQEKNNKNIWSVIPGKFTLAFSIAPNFIDWYIKNPRKFFDTSGNENDANFIDETVWEIQKKVKLCLHKNTKTQLIFLKVNRTKFLILKLS